MWTFICQVSADQISLQARRLLTEKIDSVEQLEVLLLLAKPPQPEWTTSAVAEELRTSLTSAAKRLRDLMLGGLVVQANGNDAYRYRPRDQAHAEAVDAVSQLYSERPYTVIELIFSKPIKNLRVYADAFRFKKEAGDA